MKVKERDQEEKRKKEKEEHKKKLIEQAKMPSRMEIDQLNNPSKKEKIEKMKEDLYKKHHTLQPKINKEVPDFNKLQEGFQKELESKKNAYKPTVPEGFSFLNKQPDNVIDEEDEETKAENERLKKLKKQEDEKKKQATAENINTFLKRNYATTEEKQLEAKKELLKKTEKKMDNLLKNNENRNANKSDLLREVVLPKFMNQIIKGEVKADQVIKPKYKVESEDGDESEGAGPSDPTEGGIFTMDEVGGGDQFMPGMENISKPRIPSKPKKEKPVEEKLFVPGKSKNEPKKIIDSTSLKTKTQIEAEELRKKKAEENKRDEEMRKAEEEGRKKKEKEGAVRVREKFGDNIMKHGKENEEKMKMFKEGFKAMSDQYENNKKDMDHRVDKKACLVEESKLS